MIDTNHYKIKLLEEKSLTEKDLKEIATKKLNLDGEEWNAVPADREQNFEMRYEGADRFEDLAERRSMEQTLENRLKKISDALDQIEDGSYGHCKICSQEIESEKLDANPATIACKAHVDEE